MGNRRQGVCRLGEFLRLARARASVPARMKDRERKRKARNGTRRNVGGVSRGNVISRYVAIGEASPHGMATAFCHTAGRGLTLSTRAESVKRRESSEHVVVRPSFFIPSFHPPLLTASPLAATGCNPVCSSPILPSFFPRSYGFFPFHSSALPSSPPLLSDSFARFIFRAFPFAAAPFDFPVVDFPSVPSLFSRFLYDSFPETLSFFTTQSSRF